MDAGSWQPQAHQPGPDTFRRLLSAQARAQQQQQHQQLPHQQPQQQLPLQHYHHHYQQHHQQQQYQQQLASVVSGQQRLVQRLARLRLEEQLSVADGNCQFRSVSEQLYGTQEFHGFVRQQAVNHIKANPASYATFLGEDFAYYCVGMAQDGTWGDELTLRAICDSFGVAVHVVTSEQRNWYLRYEPLSYKSRLEVFLTYIAPMHYNSLRRQKMFGRHPHHVSHIAGH
ncbi:hypothetical protein OEZ85_010831 [Tetradesmus obliquus]|uniref:OTU domain-containing protein n=1 Tax=Tetradesmus obliquus TaxID=3088 RepID=A0ABY8TSB2_TETOB|nr:hypothetical protein OEZ85_010831 [Tetradesmus obliquus]